MLIAVWLFAPGLLAAFYFYSLIKRPLNPVPFLSTAVVFSFFIALFISGISYLVGNGSREWTSMFASISNLIKYGVLALIAAAAFPNLAYLLLKLLKGNRQDETRS